jgi:hypothetical protein
VASQIGSFQFEKIGKTTATAITKTLPNFYGITPDQLKQFFKIL